MFMDQLYNLIMLIEPIYYAVFFDTVKPRTTEYALNKRITAQMFRNLTDDNGTKTVELKTVTGKVAEFKIISVTSFQILNTVDNSFFAVCDCKKN